MFQNIFARVKTINGHKLFSTRKVRLEPVVETTSDAIMIKFAEKDFIVDCVKGLLEVDKNTYCFFIIIKSFPNLLSYTYKCMVC